MLRLSLGVIVLGLVAVLPISIGQAGTGHLPGPVVNQACAQTRDCCFEVQSICFIDDEPLINSRSSGGDPCKPDAES